MSNQRPPNVFTSSIDEGHVLAPAGLAAQADAVDLVLGGPLSFSAKFSISSYVGWSGMEAGLLEEVLAVVGEGALGIERQGVKLALAGRRASRTALKMSS